MFFPKFEVHLADCVVSQPLQRRLYSPS